MAQENNILQNRVRIGGTDYYLSIDIEPVEGSGKPISSDAAAQLKLSLSSLLNRGVVDNVARHAVGDKGAIIYNNDTNLVSAEAVRSALDSVYKAINQLAARVTALDGDTTTY